MGLFDDLMDVVCPSYGMQRNLKKFEVLEGCEKDFNALVERINNRNRKPISQSEILKVLESIRIRLTDSNREDLRDYADELENLLKNPKLTKDEIVDIEDVLYHTKALSK